MADSELTKWYLDKVKAASGGENWGSMEKLLAGVTATPFLAADKVIELLPEFAGTLKRLMDTNPLDPSTNVTQYAMDAFNLASNVVGGGVGTSLVAEKELGGTVLAMNKAEGLRELAKSIYSQAKSLPEKEREQFLEKAQAVYKNLDERVSQYGFDPIESIKITDIENVSSGKNLYGFFDRDTRGGKPYTRIDVNKAPDAEKAVETAMHELAHGATYKMKLPYDEYLSKAYSKGLEYAERSKEFDFSMAKDMIYKRVDPDEALARWTAEEMRVNPKAKFEDVHKAYADKFLKDYAEYASKPGDPRGLQLGADAEQFFKNYFNDRAANRALKEILIKEGKLI